MKTDLFVIGNNLLVLSGKGETKTASGLILPDSAQKSVVSGMVTKVGRGIHYVDHDSETGNPKGDSKIKYIPLEVRPGDMIHFHVSQAVQVKTGDKDYFVVNINQVLLVERPDYL